MQGAHPSSVMMALCHSSVFQMEQQRLCPSLGHKEAQSYSPQRGKSQ